MTQQNVACNAHRASLAVVDLQTISRSYLLPIAYRLLRVDSCLGANPAVSADCDHMKDMEASKKGGIYRPWAHNSTSSFLNYDLKFIRLISSLHGTGGSNAITKAHHCEVFWATLMYFAPV